MYKKLLKLGLMLVLGLALMLTSTVLAADGSLDATFDNDGWTTTDFGSNDEGIAVALQSDGKIVVAGNSNNDFAVARYNSNGSLDTSFDSDGMLTTDLTGGNDEAQAVAIQSDGKIVVAGRSYTGSSYDFAVVRYNSDGTLDTTFSDDGIVTTDFNNDLVLMGGNYERTSSPWTP